LAEDLLASSLTYLVDHDKIHLVNSTLGLLQDIERRIAKYYFSTQGPVSSGKQIWKSLSALRDGAYGSYISKVGQQLQVYNNTFLLLGIDNDDLYKNSSTAKSSVLSGRQKHDWKSVFRYVRAWNHHNDTAAADEMLGLPDPFASDKILASLPTSPTSATIVPIAEIDSKAVLTPTIKRKPVPTLRSVHSHSIAVESDNGNSKSFSDEKQVFDADWKTHVDLLSTEGDKEVVHRVIDGLQLSDKLDPMYIEKIVSEPFVITPIPEWLALQFITSTEEVDWEGMTTERWLSVAGWWVKQVNLLSCFPFVA